MIKMCNLKKTGLNRINLIFILYASTYFIGSLSLIYGLILNIKILTQILQFLFLIIIISASFFGSKYKGDKIKFKGNKIDWLKLHRRFILFELYGSMLLFIISVAPFIVYIINNSYFTIFEDINLRGIHLSLSLFAGIMFFRYIQQIENIYNMGYTSSKKFSLYGSSAFADFSYYYLKLENKIKGLKYLFTSLMMLKGTLKDRSLESEILDNVLRTVKNIDLFDTENLEPYKELAYSLSKYSRITKFIECLEKFINRSEFIKADKLKPIQEERTIITLLKNSTLISFIVGMLILIPEKYKPSILNSFFTLLGNGGLIIIIILLFYIYMNY